MATIAQRFAALKVQSARSKQRVMTRTSGSSRQTTELPLNKGFIVTNNSSNRTMRYQRSELLTTLSLSSTDVAGPLTEFPLNPASDLFSGSQLQQLVRISQQFRFNRLSLRFGNTTATANGGSIVIAYTENPDQSISSLRDIFNLPGSKTFPLWMPADITAYFKNPKMYNVDPDSAEIMQTTQGKFVIGLINPPTTTGTSSYPLFMDYEVSLYGAATQDFGSKPAPVFPASGGVGNDGGHGTFVVLTPQTAADKYNAVYLENMGYTNKCPVWALSEPTEVLTSATESILGTHMKVRDGTTSELSVQFFHGLDAAIADTPINNLNTGPVALVLTQITERVLN